MKRGIFAALILLGSVMAWPTVGTAQPSLSPGCHALNDPALDATYRLQEVGPLEFFAGETVTVVAGASPDPDDDVRFQVLSDTGAIMETQGGPVPATFSFTVPADAILSMRWLVLGTLSASWTVSCAAAPYPLAVSAPRRANHAALRPPVVPSVSSAGFPLATMALVAGAVFLNAGVWCVARRRPAADAPGRSSAGLWGS